MSAAMQPPPDSPEDRLRWLVDRAEIADLMVKYARCIDQRDWTGMQDCYAADGVMDHGAVAVGREGVPELSEKILTGVDDSHHVVDAPAITVEGDSAELHCHYFATHIATGGTVIRHGGGWYDCDLRRTPEGWRFTRVKARSGWRSGEPLRLS